MASARIRICFTVDSSYAGGAERYLSLIIRGLDPQRFERHVLADAVPGLDAWCSDLVAAGIAVTRVSMGVPFRPWRALPVWRALGRIGADIVHVNMPGPYNGQMGLLAPLARLAGARAVLVTEHLPMVERLWKRAALKRCAFLCVDRVLTICKANVPFLIERQRVAAHKIAVVYNGVPDVAYADRASARTRLGIGENTRAVVFLGSLIARKGVRELISAVSGLAHSDWRLLIAGTGEEAARLQQQARQSPAARRIDFLGELSDDGVTALLAAGDLLVVPSFMEGMPYVILEAMAAGLPVVASAVNGIPEAVSDGVTGLLVAPGDIDGLRGAIDVLLANEERRANFGGAGRRRFEQHFALENHLREMQNIYLDTLGYR